MAQNRVLVARWHKLQVNAVDFAVIGTNATGTTERVANPCGVRVTTRSSLRSGSTSRPGGAELLLQGRRNRRRLGGDDDGVEGRLVRHPRYPSPAAPAPTCSRAA